MKVTLQTMDNSISGTEKRFHFPHLTQNAKTLLCCFGIPFFTMIVIYCCMQVWPVGKNSVLVLDLNAQYIYYFEQLRDILTGNGSILYSFERALGGEFMGIFAYYLSSPFSLIVALFPKDMITEAMYVILVLKCGCTGLAFGYLLNKTRGDRLRCVYQVMFSTMYALSGFAVVMQHNVMWTDNLIAFPLILVAMDALICQWKYRLYVTVLAYSILSNFYIGYMTCLFVFIWFFIRYFTLSREERNPEGIKLHFLRTLSQIAWWSVLAVLISGIIILPIYYSLSFGKLSFSSPDFTPKQLFDFADIISKAYFGSYDTVRPTGMPFIYCGTLALMIAPLYFFTDTVPTRRKIGFAAIMLVLIASFNFSIADIVWHGMQRPNWLNARFAYMFVGIELLMAADAMIHLKEIGKKAVMASAVGWSAMLLILDALEVTKLDDFQTVWPSLLLFTVLCALVPACIRNMHDPKTQRFAALALCCVVVTEAILSSVISLYRFDADVSYSNRNSYREFVDEYSRAMEVVDEYDDDTFYRMEKLVHRKKNDNFALNINGLSNSTSTLNARVVKLLQQFGYSSQSHWSMYSGSTPVTDALFGIRYLIADESASRKVPEYIHNLYTLLESTEDHLDVYENPYALSLAYAVDEDILKYDAPAETTATNDSNNSPVALVNKLFSSISSKKEKKTTTSTTVNNYTDPFIYMNKLGLFFPAFISCIFATRCKFASFRKIEGMRYSTGNCIKTGVCRSIKSRNGEHESFGVRMRMFTLMENSVSRSHFNYLSAIHNRNIVCDLVNNTKVVGDEKNCGIVFIFKFVDELKDLCLNGNVKRSGGFVCDKNLRFASKSHSDHYTLTHTTGNFVWESLHSFFNVGDFNVSEHVSSKLICFLLVHFVNQKTFCHLITDSVYWIQRVERVLEDDTDFLTAHFSHFVFSELKKVFAFEVNGTAGNLTRFLDELHNAHSCSGFTAAGLANQGKYFTFFNIKTYVIYCFYSTAGGFKLYAEIFNIN